MTPEEARARARSILETQKEQVIELNADGSLADKNQSEVLSGKKTVLHDPEGEFGARHV